MPEPPSVALRTHAPISAGKIRQAGHVTEREVSLGEVPDAKASNTHLYLSPNPQLPRSQLTMIPFGGVQ